MNFIVLLLLLVAPVYLVWMLFTAWKRRWRELGIQIAGCTGLVIALLIITRLQDTQEKIRYSERVFGVAVRLPSPAYEFNSLRAFNGDGYSIAVYSLPREIRAQFEQFDSAQMGNYPKKSEYRSNWTAVEWRPTPLAPSAQKYLEFALQWSLSGESKILQESLRNRAKRAGSYIAFFFKEHGQHVGNVDLFMVDLDNDRLYLINLNT